jgi:hypothetical protein
LQCGFEFSWILYSRTPEIAKALKTKIFRHQNLAGGLRNGQLQLAFVFLSPPKVYSLKRLRCQELIQEGIRLAIPANHRFAG